MDTKPEYSPRNHRADDQCPNCGRYNPQRQISYENPRTGVPLSTEEIEGPYIRIIGIVAFCAVVGLFVGASLVFNLNAFSVLCWAFFMGVFGAFIATYLYWAYRRNRLRKTHITSTHFVCIHCKNEWTVTQEPSAKKLS